MPLTREVKIDNGWCYAFGFACRNYQLSTELSAKLTYSTCCTQFLFFAFLNSK